MAGNSVQEATISVDYDEVFDSYVTENIDVTQAQIVKRYRVNWLDRWKFYQDVLGRTVQNPDNTLTRVLPLRYPDASWLYAKGVNATPFGVKKDSSPPFEYAIVDVSFGTYPWANTPGEQNPGSGGLFRNETLEIAGEVLQLPASAYKFKSDPTKRITHNVGRIIPLVNITVSQEQCPYIPYDVIFSCSGCVNETEFYKAPIGTVMFMGCQTEAQFSIADWFDPTQDKLMQQKITSKFAYRPIPWNQFLKPDGTGFDEIQDANGNPVYPSAELNDIFF